MNSFSLYGPGIFYFCSAPLPQVIGEENQSINVLYHTLEKKFTALIFSIVRLSDTLDFSTSFTVLAIICSYYFLN